MALSLAHTQFRAALVASGWQIKHDVPLSEAGAPNPSRLHIRRGRLERRLLVYAWKITSEGRGRRKAGRDDLDWRVQTTRSHDGDLRAPAGYLSAGLGLLEKRGVFAAFDTWVKRTTGWSSSAHFTDTLITAGARHGWAEELRPDGPTCSFRPQMIDRFLIWLMARHQQSQVMAVDPLEYSPDEAGAARLHVDPRRSWRYLALRPGDCLVLRRHGRLLDQSLWRIDAIETDRQVSAAGSNRPYLYMNCHRYGIVRDDACLETKI